MSHTLPHPHPQKRHAPIGEILVRLGRISPDDVERALAHQRSAGGFFGEALVALGLVAPGEVEWGLADQYDLPFVHLHPDTIDRELAARVPAAWAREHRVLPVLHDGDAVTVVLADPRALERLEEVRALIGAARVEAALSTPAAIDALVEAVHGAAPPGSLPLEGFLDEARRAGAEAVGVSLAGGRALGWWRAAERVERVLEGDVPAALRRVVSPFPEAGEGVRRWRARVSVPGASWSAECHAVGGGDALEWVAHPWGAEPAHSPAARADAGVRAAVALALRRGSVLVAVPADARPGALAGLPAALLDTRVRSVHLSARAEGPEGVPHSRLAGPLGEALEALLPFALDALTVEADAASDAELEKARRAARLVAVSLRSGAPAAADLRLRLDPEAASPTWVYDGAD